MNKDDETTTTTTNAKELRIGNWLKFDTFKDFCFVCRIKEDGFSVRSAVTNQMFNYADGRTESIPLTPEILAKCGFESMCETPLYRLFIPNSELLFENGAITLRLDERSFELNIKCEHLHQLQNLFFALTGEELTVKL